LSFVSWSIKVSGRSLILFVCIILILLISVVILILVARRLLLLFIPLILWRYFLSELRPSRSSLLIVVRKHPLKSNGFLFGLHESAIERVVIFCLPHDSLVPTIDIVVVRAIPTVLSQLAVLVVRNGMEDAVIFKLILVVRSGRTLLVAPPIWVDQRV
jgi:hypothetical protein